MIFELFLEPMDIFYQTASYFFGLTFYSIDILFIFSKMANTYTLLKALGHGYFGNTYMGRENRSGKIYAIKVIDLVRSTQRGVDEKLVRNEIEVLKRLATPSCNQHVVCYHHSFQQIVNGRRAMFIISEFINGDTLAKTIAQYGDRMPMQMLWNFYGQLIDGLAYIHHKSYSHRDIKPDNIMVTKQGILKYIDFGLTCLQACNPSRCIDECSETNSIGTTLYLPPENYSWTRLDIGEPFARDVWALALVMWECAFGLQRLPFPLFTNEGRRLSEKELIDSIVRAPWYAPDFRRDQGQVNELLEYMIVNNYKQRPNIDQVQALYKRLSQRGDMGQRRAGMEQRRPDIRQRRDIRPVFPM